MTTHRGEVNSVEQPVQLLHREFNHGTVLLGPDKACIFQSLLQQPKAIAIPAQDLDTVLSAVAKDKDGMGKGVQAQVVFNDRAQAVDVLAEVHFAAVQVHRQVGVQMEHGKAAKVRSTSCSAAVLV